MNKSEQDNGSHLRKIANQVTPIVATLWGDNVAWKLVAAHGGQTTSQLADVAAIPRERLSEFIKSAAKKMIAFFNTIDSPPPCDPPGRETQCQRITHPAASRSSDENFKPELSPQFALLVPEFTRDMARALTTGAQKYAPYSWKGALIEDRYNSLCRHIDAFVQGIPFDEDLANRDFGCRVRPMVQVAVNAMFLDWLSVNQPSEYEQFISRFDLTHIDKEEENE